MPPRPEVTLTQLKYFVEAAECLSMTLAAQRLLISQSAVSTAVAQLETQVGAQLFIRQRSKGLVLTAAGQQLFGDARAVIVHLEETLDSVRGVDNQVRGTVRIAFFVTLAPFLLPAVIAKAQERHPYLDIEVEEVDAAGVRDALMGGRAEFAVGYDFGFGQELKVEVVSTSPAHVVLPLGHPLSSRSRVALRELSRDRLILLDLPHSREYFLGILATVGIEPEIRHRSRSYETVRSFVAEGLGYSILNQRPLHDTTYGGGVVVTRPIADAVPGLDVVITSLKSVRSTARARAVGDIVREVIRSRTPPT